MTESEPRRGTLCHVRRLADWLLRAHPGDPELPTREEIEQLASDCEQRQREREAREEELQKVQRQLERYRDRYVDLYDFAPLGYVALDEDGYVQEINLAGAGMLAAERDAVIGYPLADYVVAEDRAAFAAHVQHCQRQRQAATAEITLQAKDGRRIPVQLHSVPVIEHESPDDQPTVFCKTALTDLTHRKQTEEQLASLAKTLELRVAQRTAETERRAAQLRALSTELALAEQQERRRLAEWVHQNLQQLLVAMRLELSPLIAHAAQADPRKTLAHVMQVLDQAIAESRRLTEELCPSVLYAQGLAAALEWLAGDLARKEKLAVHCAVDRHADPAEESVRVFLFQAARELLLNVAQHAGVQQALVAMRAEGEDRVSIEVRDAGEGFDPASLKGREATFGGAFGLFSIRERLDALGGRMDLETAPGQGTRVRLIAPRHAVAAGRPSVAAASLGQADVRTAVEERMPSAGDPPRAATRVLLADDHRIIRKGLAAMLRRRPDIEVVGEASDGEEAVRMAVALRPDVVLMDVVMPRLGGVEATRQIKAQAPEIRIIGLSMYEEGEMPAAMQDAGVARYITKTASADTLLAAVLGQ